MLDVVTVFTYNAVINLSIMMVATVAWARNPHQKEITFWAIAAWFMVIGTICSSLTEHVPYNILGYIGGVIYVARTGLIRLGFKEFFGQPYSLWQAFNISFVVCIGLVLAEFLEDPTPVRIALIYLGSAINLALGMQDLWRGKSGERLPSGRLAAMVYAAYALTSLAIVPLPILYPIRFEGTTPISDWLTYTSMLLLVFNLLAFLMAMVLKLERSGEIQRQLAERDHLTGIVNRRIFLQQAARLAPQPGTAIAVLDLDHFKRINDTYGHRGGDDALVQFAQRTQLFLPPDAVFGRLGGEEFGICLPGRDRAFAWNTLNTVRLALSAEDICSGEQRFRLTLSCGLVVTQGPPRSLDAWMAMADAGLYAAKNEGRNRVVLQEPPQPQDEPSTPQMQLGQGDWDKAARLSA